MADHLIQKGQTLSTIAQQYNVSIDTLMKLNPQLKNPNSIMAGASLKISQDVPTAKAEKTIKGAELEKSQNAATTASQSNKYSTKDIAVGGLVAGVAWKMGNDAYGVAKNQAKRAGKATVKVAKNIPSKVSNITHKAATKAKAMAHSMKATGTKLASKASAKYHNAVKAGKDKIATLKNKANVKIKKGTGKVSNLRTSAINKAKSLVSNLKAKAMNTASSAKNYANNGINKAKSGVKTALGKGKGLM